mmetsp:Transcript_103705/g.329752  ORF Transcript_103705/g.329752 Transcript_103705/m.329752 type:complete len:229 (+) Transcript_103705:302-988(+)
MVQIKAAQYAPARTFSSLAPSLVSLAVVLLPALWASPSSPRASTVAARPPVRGQSGSSCGWRCALSRTTSPATGSCCGMSCGSRRSYLPSHRWTCVSTGGSQPMTGSASGTSSRSRTPSSSGAPSRRSSILIVGSRRCLCPSTVSGSLRKNCWSPRRYLLSRPRSLRLGRGRSSAPARRPLSSCTPCTASTSSGSTTRRATTGRTAGRTRSLCSRSSTLPRRLQSRSW